MRLTAAEAAKRFKLILRRHQSGKWKVKRQLFAVDACSGVEASKGIKDHRKILELAAKLKSIKK
jgi:hypothetical protein